MRPTPPPPPTPRTPPCLTYSRLLQRYQIAALAYGIAVRELTQNIGCGKDMYDKFYGRSERTREFSSAAREELDLHVKEHGCGKPPVPVRPTTKK